MKCPICGQDTRVIRTSTEAFTISRERQCKNSSCIYIFSTKEMPEPKRLRVIKTGGRAQYFDVEKLRRSISLACGKLDIPPDEQEAFLQAAVTEIYKQAGNQREIRSEQIGREVIRQISQNDIAVVRYSSYYIKDVNAFKRLRETIMSTIQV